MVLDDYTPPGAWSAAEREMFSEDTARRIWFESQIFRAREVIVRPDQSVILAVRTR